MKKLAVRILKILAITAAVFVAILFLLPILFPGKIAASIRQWANQSITGELNFSKARLSFFKHFPTLTLTLHDFSLKGSAPFAKDTLLSGDELSFGLKLNSLFGSAIEVDEFFIHKALVQVLVDEHGKANYNIYRSADSSSKKPTGDTKSTNLKIKGIYFTYCRLKYHDQSIPMIIAADGFNYEGRGDLAKDVIELNSKIRADSLDFKHGDNTYLRRRKLDAELVTGIDTRSLAFRFHKNNLLINKLPVDFSGTLAILKDGYDVDLHVISGTTDLANVFTALPPDYEQWFSEMKFGGTSQVLVDLSGPYRSGTGQSPDLGIRLWVRNGSIRHNKAPAPVENLKVKASLLMPKLNADSLLITADSLYFTLSGSTTSGNFKWKGMTTPYVKADLVSKIDLGLLDRALALSIADLQGQVDAELHADGYYRVGLDTGHYRPDTIIQSIPAFNLRASVANGYFKYRDLPMALDQVTALVWADCSNSRWQDITIDIEKLNAMIGTGTIAGSVSVSGLKTIDIKADLKVNMPLNNLNQSIPIRDYTFNGQLNSDIHVNGRYDAANKKFPVVRSVLQLSDGLIQTPYYPAPVQQINLDAEVNSKKGSMDDLAIKIRPLSFMFEGKPFQLEADLFNLDNLRYSIKADGILDLGKIYEVFVIRGYHIKGLLNADLSLAGTQSDALNKRIDRLSNNGSLRVENMELRADEYPYPFFIPAGTLTFNEDKAWLRNLQLNYRNNGIILNGYAQNYIGYYLQGSALEGKLTTTSNRLVVDDFMVFAGNTNPETDSSAAAGNGEGVVMLPGNLNLQLNTSIKHILYGSSKLDNLQGELTLQKSRLAIKDAEVGIAGAIIRVNGEYVPVDLRNATFRIDLKADSFDVKRAYNEIPLFRELAPAAAKTEGLISVQYALAGRLDAEMKPVYPSIKGKGEIRLEHVKINGLKLFSAVSKATGKDSINNPDLKAVILRSSIQNNIVTIERTKMKIFGFRPRIEGQTSLDGQLNLRFRLGLPPFGIIGIPMTVTGNSEQPIVKMRKGKKEDELEEVEDDADDKE